MYACPVESCFFSLKIVEEYITICFFSLKFIMEKNYLIYNLVKKKLKVLVVLNL